MPPEKRPGDVMKRISRGGIDDEHARALVLGFVNYPEALEQHTEQLASLPIAEATLARVRDRLVDAAVSGEMLDRETLATILRETGAASRP